MRAYIITTGAFFALVAVAHLLRIVLESHALATDPANLAVIAISGALCGWACVTLRHAK
jgi:hypothetical protein